MYYFEVNCIMRSLMLLRNSITPLLQSFTYIFSVSSVSEALDLTLHSVIIRKEWRTNNRMQKVEICSEDERVGRGVERENRAAINIVTLHHPHAKMKRIVMFESSRTVKHSDNNNQRNTINQQPAKHDSRFPISDIDFRPPILITKLDTTMFNPIIILGLLSAAASALPTGGPISESPCALTLMSREEGSCKTRHLITEANYYLGVNSYCDMFFKPGGRKDPITKRIDSKHPLLGTVELPAYDDKKTMRWTYIVKIEDSGPMLVPTDITYDMCKSKFTQIMKEGKLGGSYCVVDGTQDVLFKSGRVEERFPRWGKVVYQARQKRE
ncbi:hypothetical protein K469DRAFT_752942 [Zopfia rhizophila CBS 207.26]|uniref:Uncharacterized protein n=1 Tax=Zopfia rhizophila CBS 207.26 TaxID=1314779 RepID=A0A6A6DTU0_9PEZI|nr:hypothetical protein K469DRAFT_752942 [Zopfia rhizophila CBS 207.26]